MIPNASFRETIETICSRIELNFSSPNITFAIGGDAKTERIGLELSGRESSEYVLHQSATVYIAGDSLQMR